MNSNGKADQEGKSDHQARSVCPEEQASLRGLVLAKVSPSTVLFVIADGVNAYAQKERDTEPDQRTPCAVHVFVVPNTGFKPSSDLVKSPHGTHEHGAGVPSLGAHAGDDESH